MYSPEYVEKSRVFLNKFLRLKFSLKGNSMATLSRQTHFFRQIKATSHSKNEVFIGRVFSSDRLLQKIFSMKNMIAAETISEIVC